MDGWMDGKEEREREKRGRMIHTCTIYIYSEAITFRR